MNFRRAQIPVNVPPPLVPFVQALFTDVLPTIDAGGVTEYALTAPQTLNGLPLDGQQRRWLLNTSDTHTLTLAHDATADGTRFLLPGATSYAVPPYSGVGLYYSRAAAAWLILDK